MSCPCDTDLNAVCTCGRHRYDSVLSSPHDHKHAALLDRLDRLIEIQAQLAGILAPRVYRSTQQGGEDGSGHATLVWPVVPGGSSLVWEIDRVVGWTDSTGTPSFALFVMDSVPLATNVDLDQSYMADWSSIGTNVADETRTVPAKGGEVVLLQWKGLSGGAHVKGRLIYRVTWQAEIVA